MKGKRVGTARKAGRHLGQQKKKEKKSKGHFPVRLIICGVLFVLLVAVKLLYPQPLRELTESASQLIGQDTDFREVFSAVGRAAGGEDSVEDSLRNAYTAAFGSAEVSENSDEDLNIDPYAPDNASGRSGAAEASDEAASGETGDVSLSGTYSLRSIPEDASLDLRDLGFSYTTPVKGTLSSTFGWREHPTGGGSKFHYGIDLAAEVGTEIVAFADGEVFAVGESSTLGKYIILVHAGGYRTLYAHCSEICVTSGKVSTGELIARVGETGSTTGPHLHFELQDGSLYLNPIYYVSVW